MNIKTKRKILIIIIGLIILLQVSLVSANNKEDSQTLPEEPIIPAKPTINVEFDIPKGWFKREVEIPILIHIENGTVEKIEFKLNQKDSWKDITHHPYVELSENTVIYIRVIDNTGKMTEKAKYIECIDREKPTVNARVNYNTLSIEAYDALSGIHSVFVNGYEYDILFQNVLNIRLQDYDNYEKISIQALDNAGNLSSIQLINNPLYIDPVKKDQERKEEERREKEREIKEREKEEQLKKEREFEEERLKNIQLKEKELKEQYEKELELLKEQLKRDFKEQENQRILKETLDKIKEKEQKIEKLERELNNNKNNISTPFQTIPRNPDLSNLTSKPVEKVVNIEKPETEIFSFSTKDGKVFHLYINRTSDANNALLLTQVDENDLTSFLEDEYGNNINNLKKEEDQRKEEEALERARKEEEEMKKLEELRKKEETKQNEENEKQDKNNNVEKKGSGFLFIIVVIGVGVVAYYVKIYKPKHSNIYDNINDMEYIEDWPEEYENEDDLYEEELSDEE